jgi:hypothetical protein
MSTATANSTKATFDEGKIDKLRKQYLHPILFPLGMLNFLPLGFVTGLRVTQFDGNTCSVTAPYKYMNRNPFKTTYWAVLGMAAEMASGAILLSYSKNVSPSVATFVVGCDSKFVNRALGVTTFVCNDGALIKSEVQKASENGEARIFTTATNGYSEDGKLVAEFIFTWSIKGRRAK